MSTSLLARATQALKAKADAGKRLARERQEEGELMLAGAGTMAGSAGAAVIDTKGKNGGPHKLFSKEDGTGGIPTNAVVGLAIAVPALVIKKFPLKGPAVATGLSLTGAALYRYIVDKHAASASHS